MMAIGLNGIQFGLKSCSLRKQPSFFAPGPTRAGSEEGRLFSQAIVIMRSSD